MGQEVSNCLGHESHPLHNNNFEDLTFEDIKEITQNYTTNYDGTEQEIKDYGARVDCDHCICNYFKIVYYKAINSIFQIHYGDDPEYRLFFEFPLGIPLRILLYFRM
jgi:hypothetical protein